MSRYITYTLEALEDIKLAKTTVQTDDQESMDYITGSSIRGAYIYKYIMKKNIENINKGIHRDKLLKGGIKFMNAYPAVEDERSIPFPKCYFAPKQKIRNFYYSLNIISAINKKPEENYERVKISEFVKIDDDNSYKIVKIRKKSNLHINTKKEENNLFRYDAIKKGQKFKGIIKVEKEEYSEEVFNLLENTTVYLGGSKGSGYGKCYIYDMKEEDTNPEYVQFSGNYRSGDKIYLLALSDIIYRTDLGQYKTYIEPKLISKELSLQEKEIEYIDSYIDTKRIVSFNNKWKCRTPQIVGIKAGSVFKYKVKSEINHELLISFMDKGIGERKAEGFGRFVILDSLENSCLYDEKLNSKSNWDFYTLKKRITFEEEEQIKLILKRIYEHKVDSEINEKVLRLYKSIKNPNHMEKSQWGNYLALFKTLYYEEPEKGKSKFEDFMKHLNTKRSSSYKQLMKLQYNDEKLSEKLEKFVKNSDNINKFYSNSKVKKINIENISPHIDNKFVYKKNMKTLIELCRYHIRKEAGEI